MIGKTHAFEILDRADQSLRHEGLEGTIVWWGQLLSTLRSARGRIHQPTISREQLLRIVVRDDGKREASMTIASPNISHIRQAIKHAKALLPSTPPNPYGAELISPPLLLPEEAIHAWDEDTARGERTKRNEFFQSVNKIAKEAKLVASARFYTGAVEMAVGNTLGLRRYHRFTIASCELVLKGIPNSKTSYVSAFAARSGKSLDDINTDEVVVEALQSATLQLALPRLDPFGGASNGVKTFDVILRPYALDAWLWWLSAFSFSGVALYHETSFLTGKIGQIVTSPDISIIDDWRYPHMIPAPFDADGMTRSRVPLIEHGVAKGVVSDGTTSNLAKLPRTGHAVLRYSNYCRPLHLVFEGGQCSFEDLIESCERPTILITYFNYPSMPDPREGIFTATSRHGTFLIEGGKFHAALPPLRLVERTLDAFSRIELATKSKLVINQDHYEGIEPSSYLVPAVKIKDMSFVGSVP